MKRRILLVDDDLAVLLTLKAVLELNGFEVETASSSAEAFARMESGVYHMVISDLRMETEEAGLEVIRTARRQTYDPATALLTAYPPSREWEQKTGDGKHALEKPGSNSSSSSSSNDDDWTGQHSDSLLIKPLGTGDLLRQVEALLVRHADRQLRSRNAAANAQNAL
jgi:CheY-like chemotaxis protein